MNGPCGWKVELWCMAKDEGLNLDELVASRWGKEDPFSRKSMFERMMVELGVTVQDLKNVDRGIFGNPEDDYYDDAKKEASQVVTPELRAALDALKYVDPIEKAKRYNKKLDWTDLPYIYLDDPWTIYPDPPEEEEEEEEGRKRTNDGEIKKKKKKAAAGAEMDDGVSTDEDDVPTPPLATAGDEQQMDDVLLCLSAAVFTWSCKRTNDGEIKKKKKDDGATVADKQAEG